MERMLRENQEQQLIATARGVATALQDRPGLLVAGPSAPAESATPASGAVRSAILTAANQIYVNVGAYPDTIWLAPDQAAELGAIVETGGGGLPSFPGMSQIGPTVELMGLKGVVDANFAAGTMIVGV